MTWAQVGTGKNAVVRPCRWYTARPIHSCAAQSSIEPAIQRMMGDVRCAPSPADCRLPSVKAVRSPPAPFKPPAGVDTVLLDHPQFSRPVC
jgi:hypothetical protein